MTLAVVQARTGSSRLPGKVLAPLAGKPMILRQIERIRRAEEVDALVVATSEDPADDALADLLAAEGVDVHRGPLDDVLARFLEVIDLWGVDDVVRLTADNPLTDPAVVDRVVAEHRASGADYTSNGLERTFPYGLDVEVVRASALRRVAAGDPDAGEREHVTLGVVRRPGEFRLHSVVQAVDHSDLRWTVDYPGDLAWAEEIYALLLPSLPRFRQDDILALLEREPRLRRTLADAP